ncbi:MAG: asparagine synthase (glutamine-hydrolyzing) [Candidatus Aminicenantes bacterium]|nr:asparagine synthase (glutamine-hydrolyzing) [Candidatus Aminicenantes bacterium]
MCGICGIINFNGAAVREPELQAMMQRIKHRGPDDQGIFISAGRDTGFGHVRLSIIDLSAAGHQPMISDDDRFVIVYNGEIYNYIELRRELRDKYLFKTQTDTEVLLNAYREWGKDCLHRFNGMFAFVIFDKKTKEIFVARDRFGIKPFYYHLDKDRFIFASEIRALLPFLKERQPHNRAIYEYLIYNRTDQGDYTFFENIKKLPHGCCAAVEKGELKIEKWYDLPRQVKEPFAAAEEFYEALTRSVKLRLRSDVPVGVCFSGGLDSSSIVSILIKECRRRDVNTFSAVYEKGDAADESEFIDEYRDQLDNMHFTLPTAESFLSELDPFIRCHPEPVPALGPYAQFKVMQSARRHVTVTLDGQGADEQLAGYHYFFGAHFKGLLRKLKILGLAGELLAYMRIHKSFLALKYLGFYLSPSFLKEKLGSASSRCMDPGFYRRGRSFTRLGKDLFSPRSLNESLLQHFEYKLEHLLKWEDLNSMWHSLESRVPFLDHHIVERTLTLPAGELIDRGVTKGILRRAMRGVLPEKIRTRQDKVGFATPWEKWFKTPGLKDMVNDILTSASFRQRGIFDPEKCLKGFEDFCAGKIHMPKETWKWINLELWFRAFIDEPPV